MILSMSSPRERTDREKNWRKTKERERECAPILLRRNRRRRDLTVSCLKCVCVCCACEFSEKVKLFIIISNERRRKSGRYFLPACTFKIWWSKKKNFIFFQKAGEQHKEKENHNTFASFFLPSFKRTHEHKHAHTHTHTHYLSNNNNNIVS